MNKKWHEFWDTKSKQERFFWIVLSIVVMVVLYYRGVMLPLNRAIDEARQTQEQHENLLAWLHVVQKEAHRPTTPALSVAALMNKISETIRATPFKSEPYQLEQQGRQEIRLNYPKVPYLSFLTWYAHFSTHYHFELKSLDVRRTQVLGVVKVTMILKEDNGSDR